MTPVVTEDYEVRIWGELNSLLADAVPEEASELEAEDLVLFALMGLNVEIHDLYEQVKRLARDDGYLCDRLEEDNPIGRARRRLYGNRA